MDGKVINGATVSIHKTVNLVSIRELDRHINKNVHFCSGYRPSFNFVLTAGICIKEIKQFDESYLNNLTVISRSQKPEYPEICCRIKKLEHFDEYNAKAKTFNGSLDIGLMLVGLLKNYSN